MSVRFASVVVVCLIAAAGFAVSSPPLVQASAPNGSWTIYHHDNAHTGFDNSQSTAATASTGWASAALDGTVYGEPLVYNGFVYVGTLAGTVYALDQATGVVSWSTNVGAPQPVLSGQCGNVNPLGILGTPVIDTTAGRIYVSEILSADRLWHVFAIDLGTHAVVLNYAIPNSIGTGFDWTIQQERGALTLSLDRSHVYVPFGGRAGDCGPYHGWVVGVPTSGAGSPEVYESPSTASGVWAAGGPLVDDATGNVFFATGNAIPCSGAVNSDSVIRTSAALGAATSFFQPQDWAANWCGPDLDLGSASPVLISPSLLFMAGKYGQGFLLNPANLGGLNGQKFPSPSPYVGADVCAGSHSDATFGSFAYAAPRVYLECDGHGIVSLTVNTAAPSFSVCDASCNAAGTWQAGGSMTFGPPIVAGGVVWAVDIGGSGLYGFQASTGAQLFHSAAFGVTHFSTPSEAGGQVFVSSDNIIRSFNMVFGCSSVSISAVPPSISGVGNPVTFTAAAGCPDPSPLYQFWSLAPGAASWHLEQPYSTTATLNWVTTGRSAGTYTVAVWARDANSTGAFGNTLGRWDVVNYLSYTLVAPTCTGLSLSSAPPAVTTVGTSVTFTGTGTCPDASPVYQFWLLAPGASSWAVVQPYSTSNTFRWVTTSKAPGADQVAAWVRDSNSAGAFSNSFGSWDVSTPIAYKLNIPACSGLGLSALPAASTSVGTSVTFTATGTCPDASPVYQFWVLAPGASSWAVVQPYSTSNTFSWSTTGKAPGAYQVAVWVRDASSAGVFSNTFGAWDVFSSIAYTVTSCTGLSLSAAPPAMAGVGASVTFTATATGCPNLNPVYQFWVLAPGASSWTVAQPYSSSNTLSWTTGGKAPGTYQVAVWVRDAGSAGAFTNSFGTWDVFASRTFTVTTCTGLTLSTSPVGITSVGTPVTVTATATGCPNPNPVYQFWVLAPGASSWTVVQPYSTSNTLSWTTPGKAPGTYQIAAWVRDASSAGAFSNSFGTWDVFTSSAFTLT